MAPNIILCAYAPTCAYYTTGTDASDNLYNHMRTTHAAQYELRSSRKTITILRSHPTDPVKCPKALCGVATPSSTALNCHLEDRHKEFFEVKAFGVPILRHQLSEKTSRRYSPYLLPSSISSASSSGPRGRLPLASLGSPSGSPFPQGSWAPARAPTDPMQSNAYSQPQYALSSLGPAHPSYPPALYGSPEGSSTLPATGFSYAPFSPSHSTTSSFSAPAPAEPSISPKARRTNTITMIHEMASALEWNCAGCWASSGAIAPQHSRLIQSCRGTHPSASHDDLKGWRTNLRTRKLPAHSCYFCGIPNEYGLIHPKHAQNSKYCKCSGFEDLHKNALYMIRRTPQVWQWVVNVYRCCSLPQCPRLSLNMTDDAFMDWIVEEHHSFYNGMELLAWLWEQRNDGGGSS